LPHIVTGRVKSPKQLHFPQFQPFGRAAERAVKLMSILSKEPVETASLKESAGSKPGAAAQPAAGALHSDAVSLEVLLKVHGSKVTEVARGVPGRSEPFEEQTSSMIVFPHGGVVRMSTPLNVGQMLILTNLKTRQDAICRVVKVRNYSNSASYVEVEFTHRQPGYWGVYFESDTPEPPVDSVSSGASTRETPAKMPANSDSGFIHFGSQEQVQPPASSTSAVPPPGKSSHPAPSPMVPNTIGDISLLESKVSQSPAPPRSAGFGVHAAQPGPVASSDVSAPIENLPASNGETASMHAAASESVDSRPVFRSAGETLSSRLGGSELSAEESTGESKNWLLIGACAAALCLAAGGGFLLLHHKPASAPAPAARSVAAQQPAPTQAEAPSTSSSQVTVTPAAPKPNVAPVAREASPAPVVKATREAPVVKESGESPSQPEPAANPPQAAAPKTSMPSVFGTLNAHPVAPTRSVSAAAPNVDAGMAPPAPANALLGITSPTSPSSVPAPAFNTNVPIPVGGRIKEPELVNKVMPQYPSLAREAHTQGDVEVQIVIDKAGNVTEAKSISGPAVLRQAAVDAVRRWKYQPTILDGQAIPVQMIVKLRFQL
jgi:TonB family protein